MQLGKKARLLVQHHAESPGRGLMRFLQKNADKVTDAYLFHSKEQAKPWMESGIISSAAKVFEVTEGSTSFRPMNGEEARRITGVSGEPSFLWVGRLNANKDPLTVLKGFAEYSATHPGARLYMIYSEDDLLPELESFLQQRQLKGQVVLVGRKAHDDLRAWYSAADFYISGSHSEGSGYALIEAMACGCIPVVTHIPSYCKMTDNGRLGFLYPPGDPDGLLHVLERLTADDALRLEVRKHFEEKLSFEAIARSIADVCGRV
jgi:glycosyltransferase involved in cell wall biosynthesis